MLDKAHHVAWPELLLLQSVHLQKEFFQPLTLILIKVFWKFLDLKLIQESKWSIDLPSKLLLSTSLHLFYIQEETFLKRYLATGVLRPPATGTLRYGRTCRSHVTVLAHPLPRPPPLHLRSVPHRRRRRQQNALLTQSTFIRRFLG